MRRRRPLSVRAEGVVHRLTRDGTDLSPYDLVDVVRRAVRSPDTARRTARRWAVTCRPCWRRTTSLRRTSPGARWANLDPNAGVRPDLFAFQFVAMLLSVGSGGCEHVFSGAVLPCARTQSPASSWMFTPCGVAVGSSRRIGPEPVLSRPEHEPAGRPGRPAAVPGAAPISTPNGREPPFDARLGTAPVAVGSDHSNASTPAVKATST